ncbi:hypothetical protein STCU_01473 [Strigomonas culicis]|nr:hypothetical protein STCU_01473 [Strigomonas culicis]|eukprot:EPY34629.1 hypothetical protein STCU_01473 [Strigomonas culicis]
MNSAFGEASKSFNNSNANTNKSGGGHNASSSSFNTIRRRFLNTWHAHKGRVWAFVAANFFGILFLIQLSQPLYHIFTSLMQPASHPSIKHNKKQEKDASLQSRVASQEDGFRTLEGEVEDNSTRQQQNGKRGTKKVAKTQSEDNVNQPWTAHESSFMYDDTKQQHGVANNTKYNSAMHRDLFESKDGERVGFETSFLVKMGDETEFTSSLEREHLTGAVSK